MRLSKMLALFVAVLVAAYASADIMIYPATTTTILNFGEAESTITVVAPGGQTDIQVSESSLYTVGSITSVPADNGNTNYTIPLSHDSAVGRDDITVTVGAETVTGVVIVAGLVIKEGGKVVSGDNGDGVTVGIEGTTTYEVMAIGTDGMAVDVSSASIVGMAMSGTYMKQLDVVASSITSSLFTLALVKYRVSVDGFKVAFEVPSITLNGEVHETFLKVMHSQTTAPCAAIGGTYTSNDGMVAVDMYNVASDVDVVISVGTTSGSADLAASSLTMPDQNIVFTFATAGVATITCDGVLVYSASDVVIDVSSTSEALAKDSPSTLDEQPGQDQITAVFRLPGESPETLSAADAELITNEFCSRVGCTQAVYGAVTAGSAIIPCTGNIPQGTGNDAEAAVTSSVESCEFQKSIKKDCGYIEIYNIEQKAVGGSVVASASGLATWTIILIAGLGALALIVLIMLGLLAVYRRSAEQSESDYSSSGPLGVPDPSDLLYEQSIVRDIYGRGDFPDGGPSPAQAEQREREAALREEFPRPPSSSGLSRGSATDDASSTYSV